MSRKFWIAAGLATVLTTTGEARAQWYGGYGWNGWGESGQTFQGNVARGLGYYYQGAGQYAVEEAQARAINTDTVMRWNQYWYEAQNQASKAEHLRMAQREKRDAQSGDYLLKQLRENPSPADIADGQALSVMLDDLSDPRVHSSSLRMANNKIPAKLIKAIPFRNASEATTICLDQLTVENGWPSALKNENLAAERKAYSQAIDKALEEDREGDISPQTIQSVRTALGTLRAKFEASPPTDRAAYNEAEAYLRTLIGMTRMLDKPDFEKALAELDKVESTTLGNLIGFMHAYNLRFARPTTPEQRNAYTSLYPIVLAHHSQVMKSLQGVNTANNNNNNTRQDSTRRPPTDFLSGTRKDAFDTPPAAPQPQPKDQHRPQPR